ncbi:MAG: potassium-transporting ATPase subunit KdpA, partial [Streptosporangiaceae bacterium]|nr:potassium-transporting ATPase subunit KdpA [Streptosporangiaceae bacterium]
MTGSLAGFLQVGLLILALAVCYRPLGDYIARVVTTDRDWRVERAIYRTMGVDPRADMRWSVYARSVLAFSAMSVLFVYLFERLQGHLFLSNGQGAVTPDLAWNTAASFTTNTNWQNYSGETTMAYLTQMSGLAVQNFVSAAVGIAVVVAMIRGFVRSRTDRLGNFWVDLTRITLRVLLPLSIIGAIILVAGGAVDNFTATHVVHTVTGSQQVMVGGPVASQEVIKEMGNNGGGFFNANSAHPFENPNGFTNIFEIFLILLIPFSLPRTFGKMIRDNRQGFALLAVMVILWAVAVGGITF